MLDPGGNLEAQPGRDDLVEKLCHCAERADAAAIQTSPQDRGHHRENRKQIPGHVVPEHRQVPGDQAEDVHDRDQLASRKPEVEHRCTHGDPLQAFALSEEAHERECRESGEHREIGRPFSQIRGQA